MTRTTTKTTTTGAIPEKQTECEKKRFDVAVAAICVIWAASLKFACAYVIHDVCVHAWVSAWERETMLSFIWYVFFYGMFIIMFGGRWFEDTGNVKCEMLVHPFLLWNWIYVGSIKDDQPDHQMEKWVNHSLNRTIRTASTIHCQINIIFRLKANRKLVHVYRFWHLIRAHTQTKNNNNKKHKKNNSNENVMYRIIEKTRKTRKIKRKTNWNMSNQ